ncbi:DNA methyltransferase 1-associated protein 1-like [Ornithodoros turicata]
MSDVLDILDIDRPSTPEISKETIMGTDARRNKMVQKRKLIEATFKRPEGMHRELYALLCSDARDNPPLLPTDSSQGYKQNKAKLGIKKVRPWRWMPFANPARKDGVMLHHWRRVADEGKEYPFANFNKQVHVPTYSGAEYQQHLTSNSWTRAETDYLLEMCRRFDLRFLVVRDRWDTTRFARRSVEDLKERYYNICNALARARAPPGQEPKTRGFDADHERRRKEQLNKLYNRTTEQVEEEQMLLNELRKIELRKKEREKKTQDLQKLITAADNSAEARRVERKGPKKKINLQKNSKTDATSIESAGIRFPDFKTCGVSLRSHRMKLPASVGQKKTKAIEQLLQELGVELNPTPTEDVCQHFNELRNDMVLLYELKMALATCEYELQTLRHQYEVLAPDKVIEMPVPASSPTLLLETAKVDSPSKGKGISEIIDVGGTAGTPNRKRRAAIEQSNLLKKFKKM